MKRITLFLVSAVLSNFLSAQRLYFSQANTIKVIIGTDTLQNAWTGGINGPLWSGIDMNGDGVTDLFMYDRENNGNGRVLTLINDGLHGLNSFHDSTAKYASLFPSIYTGGGSYRPSWARLYDYNCDGKPDFFTFSPLCQCIAVYRNDYTPATGLKWTHITDQLMEKCNSFTNPVGASSNLVPAFVDMDDDGDLDIVGFNSNADYHLFYHKNYAVEHFGRCDTFDYQLETKCWGNFAFSAGSNQYSCIHCPLVPTLTCPAPEDQPTAPDSGVSQIISSPPTAQRDDTITSILCLDLDGDGLKDMLIGDVANPNCLMLHNAGTNQVAEIDTEDVWFPSYNVPVKDSDFVYSSYIDVDNDGLNDLISCAEITSDKNNIWVYKNSGTNIKPVFNFQKRDFILNSMIDEGEAAQPIMFDYDADNVKDLIIAYGVAQQLPAAGVHSKLAVYKNIGTANDPRFKFITDDYMNIDQYNLPNPICVTFGDLRCSGVQDMVIGAADGWLYYFQNAAAPGQPANFPSLSLVKYGGIDVGNNAAPQLVDMDGDGLLDLIVGAQAGVVIYYHNGGTCSAPSFSSTPTNAAFGNIDVKWGLYGYSVPFVFKNNGAREMMVSNNKGAVYYYNNIDGNLGGAFTKVDSFFNGSLGIRLQSNLTVTVGDVNNDGLQDMLVGLFSGGVKIYYGSHTPNTVTELESNNSFVCFPNPANSSFEISGLKFEVGSKIELFNILGVKIYSKQLQTSNFPERMGTGNPQTTIDVSRLASGLYIVVVSSSGKSSYQKLLISH